MKTAEEIINAMIEEMPYRLPYNTVVYIKEAMHIYAQQACEDLRERIAEEACLEPNGMLLQVDKQSILETEIILP